MSATAAWTYTNVCTVYPLNGIDGWHGNRTFGTPYLINATWGSDSSLSKTSKEDRGEENTYKHTIYTESKYGGVLVRVPVKGDFIALGDTAGNPDPVAAGADEVRRVHQDDMSFFNEDPDYEVITDAS